MKIGCIKDKKDIRDKIYSVEFSGNSKRKRYDFRNRLMPKIYNQYKINNCTMQSLIATIEYQGNVAMNKLFNGITDNMKLNDEMSKMFIYYVARKMNDNESKNCGLSIRVACKSYIKYGTVFQTEFSDDNHYTIKPSFDNLFHADEYKSDAYYRITKHESVLDSLDKNIPVIIGTDVTPMRDAKHNKGYSKDLLTLTEKGKPNHAMLIVGFLPDLDYLGKKLDCYIVRNSWGDKWGDEGYCYVPVEIFWKYLCFDAWVVIKKYDSTLDAPKQDCDKLTEIPSNTVVIGRYAFDLGYAENKDNRFEITNVIRKNSGDIYIRQKDGEWVDNNGDKKTTLSIPTEIIYKDKEGQTFTIILR